MTEEKKYIEKEGYSKTTHFGSNLTAHLMRIYHHDKQLDFKNRITKILTVQALALLLLPLVFIIVNDFTIEKSISQYANHIPMTFGFLMTLSGVVFCMDGLIFKKRKHNIYIGVALFMVILFRNTEFPFFHYVFAGIFFVGYLFNIVFFSSKEQRKIKIALVSGVASSGLLILYFTSIFWFEWFMLFPFVLNYLLELFDRVD